VLCLWPAWPVVSAPLPPLPTHTHNESPSNNSPGRNESPSSTLRFAMLYTNCTKTPDTYRKSQTRIL
jgi:hypothetical protein